MATYHELNEDETCRTFVLPALTRAGWNDDQIRRQYRINEGRLVATSRYHAHSEPLIADYVLEHGPDLPIGVVEAKRTRANAADGIEQAKRYALRLDLPFAYATNGRVIYEVDLLTGRQAEVSEFPSPDELWGRHLTHHEIGTQLAFGEHRNRVQTLTTRHGMITSLHRHDRLRIAERRCRQIQRAG